MSLSFDDAAADHLARVLEQADDALRDQGMFRHKVSRLALEDFEGGYGNLFRVAVEIEKGNRGKLASVLHGLSGDVKAAKVKADEERTRLRQMAAWKERDAERERRRQSEAFGDVFSAGVDSVFDPMPSDTPVAPPTISASFSAHQRYRTAGAAMPGKSSADPVKLNSYISQSRASNADMEGQLTLVRRAWSSFTSSCSWVRIESASFLSGFQQLLFENQKDVDWIDSVAAAFEAAGGGALSNKMLDLSATQVNPLGDAALLESLATLSAGEIGALFVAAPGLPRRLRLMDPGDIHAWWLRMDSMEDSGGQFSAQQLGLLEGFPVLFGNLEGLPYGARHHANELALGAAIGEVKAELERLKSNPDADVSVLQTQLNALQNIQSALKTPKHGDPRFLISLTEDRPPLAAVSIGDLDTAACVSYAVPGMGTDTTGMKGWTVAAQNLHSLLPENSAVVAWIGYETPPTPLEGNLDFGVLGTRRAVAGGNNLAAALRGVAAVRDGSMPQLDVVAHSYGATTAAVALTQAGVQVKNFITLGAAGLPNSVDHASDLHAEHVYSGHSRDRMAIDPESGDQWAWAGRDFSLEHRVNPMLPEFGGQPFGVDSGGDAGEPVVDHASLLPGGGGYFSEQTESLQNVARVIAGELNKVTEYVPLGPTALQEGMITSATSF